MQPGSDKIVKVKYCHVIDRDYVGLWLQPLSIDSPSHRPSIVEPISTLDKAQNGLGDDGPTCKTASHSVSLKSHQAVPWLKL